MILTLSLVKFIHRCGQAFSQQERDSLADFRNDRVDDPFLFVGEIPEDKVDDSAFLVGGFCFGFRSSDADSDTVKLRCTDPRVNGFGSLMPSRAAAQAQANLAHRKVEVVMDNDEGGGRYVELFYKGTDRLPPGIHI